MRILQTPLVLHLHLNSCCLQKIGIIRTQSNPKKWAVDGCTFVAVMCVLGSDVWFQSASVWLHTLTFVCFSSIP